MANSKSTGGISGLTQGLNQLLQGWAQHGHVPTAFHSSLLQAAGRVQGAWVLPRPRSALGQRGAALALLLVVVLTALALGRAIEAARDFWTGVQYGDPRTNHLMVAFGVEGEGPGRPSLVTAVNTGGDVLIYVTIGGKADQTVVLVVPGADPTGGRGAPLLSAADLTGDGHPDLVVGMTTNSAGWLFLNDGTTLRPPTEAELDQIHSGHGP